MLHDIFWLVLPFLLWPFDSESSTAVLTMFRIDPLPFICVFGHNDSTTDS